MGNTLTFIVWCLIWGVVSAGICVGIANAKGRPISEALVLGGLLGVIGVLIMLCLRSERRDLPPAGWYPLDGRERYWTGTQWSNHPPMPEPYEPSRDLT
jgi:hypothetical protein